MRSIFFRNPPSDASNTVFLCGSGRSGTTWLADLLNSGNEYRYMFEPFSARNVPECRHFNIRQYLRPDNTDADYVDPATAIVTGQIRRRWVDKYNRRFAGERRLIKDIRVNLFVAWLRQRFPRMKMVFIMRHPAAVTLSRMGRKWRARTDDVLEQGDLVEDHLQAPLARMGEPRDRLDRHMMMWCIENLVPLRQLAADSVHAVYYEHLCIDPEATLRSVMAALGHEFDAQVLARVQRPSRQAAPNSAIRRGGDLVAKWRTKLTTAQIDRILAYLAAFGLDKIYSDDPMPVASDPFSAVDGCNGA